MRDPNPSPHLHSFRPMWRFLITFSFLFLSSSSTIDGHVWDSGQNHTLEWQVLTKSNFSSELRLHQYVLLIVTVPWSGESKALMKDIAHAAAFRREKLDHLRLMVIYINREKMLAKALAVTEATTVFFYNQAVPYKYQGRLRTQNILSSANHFMSIRSEELPLKSLNTPEDLHTFFQSTDKAILLLEFCGWTARLLGRSKNNGSVNAFHAGDASDIGIISGSKHKGEADLTHKSSWEKHQGLNYEELTCGIENELSGIPWFGEFTLANDSGSEKAEDALSDSVMSCTLEEFRRFESFFSNFTTFAREFFLPLERRRFGLVSKRSLLSSLGVQDPDSWHVMLHFAGCPKCSKILKKEEDLTSALDTNHLLVTELEGEAHDVESALPANRPSVILFVDRSAESPDTRRKSKAALETFRKLALNNQLSYQMAEQNSVIRRESPAQAFQGMMGRSSSSSNVPDISRKPSPFAQVDHVQNEMSLMIIDDNGNIALDDIHADAKRKSIRDILAYLLQQKKGSKLSSLAKDAGFQLLSDDLLVKVTKLLPREAKSKSDNGLLNVPLEQIVESGVNLKNNNALKDASLIQVTPKGQTSLADFESQFKDEKISYVVKNTQLIPFEQERMFANSVFGVARDMIMEEKRSTGVEKLEMQQAQHRDFRCVYFFSDGGYQLLTSLTTRSKSPSMVIVDPISEQHYVYQDESSFGYFSLQGFLDAFLNGSLIPYQHSESVTHSPRDAPRPPFVNMDFREMDSIPRVTAHTFSELVLGYNQSDSQIFGYSWKKDVLVLFSNSWCGFCQRMELVVREVFRAFKGYMNTLKSVSKNRELTSTRGIMGDAALAVIPLIFLMDCTLNDCSSLLNPMGQRELYPALLLFPAQRKSAVSYRGDMSVNNVIKFLIDHGSNSHHLNGAKGILWTARQKEGTDGVLVEDASPSSVQDEVSVAEANHEHEVLLNYKEPTSSSKIDRTGSHTSNGLQEATFNVVVGSVLISTDKLLNASPFDKSVILVVQANQSTGFLGLIINKHISWDSFQGLERGLEMVKQAPLSFGGPVISHGMPLVSLSRGIAQEGYSEVFQSVYFLDQLATTRELDRIKSGNLSSNDYWFFLGHAGWGWNQLFSEITEGAWQVSVDPETLLNWPRS